jgi:Ala-tRNA(Pro) deacylase
MYLAHRVSTLLHRREIEFDTIPHAPARTSRQSAALSHVPLNSIAKGVLFRDDEDFVLAIVPASSRVDPEALGDLLGAEHLELADEDDLPFVFTDCERGAIPPMPDAYGLTSVLDASLLVRDDIYFEGGDHEHLVHVRGPDFRRLMGAARKALISYPD